MNESDERFLRYMLEAIDKIEAYISVGLPTFMSETHWQDAIIRQLEIIGESTKNLSFEIRFANPQVPWQRIAGMRDVLIHDFMDIDLAIVWSAAGRAITELRQNIIRILGEGQKA